MTEVFELGRLVDIVEERVGGADSVTPLSVSEIHGIVRQDVLYNKKIALEDQRKYRMLRWGDIAYNPFLLWNRAVGACFLPEGGCVSPAYVVLRPRHTGIERFLHYFLRSKRFTSRINAIASGTVTRRRTVPVDDVLAQAFELPSVSDQQAINEFLASVDSCIEARSELGRHLDRLCFEDFRRELGELGKDVRFGDYVNLNPTGVKEKQSEDTIQYVDVGSVRTNESDAPERLKWSDAPSRAKRLATDGDVIFGTVRPGRRSLLLIVSPPPDLVISTGFAVMRPRDVLGSSELLSVIYDPAFAEHFASVAEGSAYPAVNTGDLAEHTVRVIAAPDISAEYEARTMPVRRYRAGLANASHALTELRNLLVPALLEGDRVIEQERLV